MNYYIARGQSRFFAALIDVFIYYLLLMVFNVILLFIYGIEGLLMAVVNYIESGQTSALFIEFFIITSFINALVGVVYYAVIPYYSQGQTIAKYFLKLVTVDTKMQNPSFIKYVLRAIVIWHSYLNVILLPVILFRFSLFTDLTASFLFVNAVLLFVSAFRVFQKEDPRGIHDLLTNTRVVSLVPQPRVDDWATVE